MFNSFAKNKKLKQRLESGVTIIIYGWRTNRNLMNLTCFFVAVNGSNSRHRLVTMPSETGHSFDGIQQHSELLKELKVPFYLIFYYPFSQKIRFQFCSFCSCNCIAVLRYFMTYCLSFLYVSYRYLIVFKLFFMSALFGFLDFFYRSLCLPAATTTCHL